MSYQILLTEQAKSDIRNIYLYIALNLQSMQNAEGQLERIENKILSLNEMPERHRVYDNEKWKKRNLRVMPVDNYLIFYISSKENENVTVVRVVYRGSDIERQLEKL